MQKNLLVEKKYRLEARWVQRLAHFFYHQGRIVVVFVFYLIYHTVFYLTDAF